MFARYRRPSGLTTSPSPATTTNKKPPLSKVGSSISGSGNHNNNNGSSTHHPATTEYNDAAAAEREAAAIEAGEQLEELRCALDRLEYLTEKICPPPPAPAPAAATPVSTPAATVAKKTTVAEHASVAEDLTGKQSGEEEEDATTTTTAPTTTTAADNNKEENNNSAGDEKKESSTTTPSSSSKYYDTIATALLLGGSKDDVNSNEEENDKHNNNAETTTTTTTTTQSSYQRSPSAAAHDLRLSSNASFLSISSSDECEMVELLRRIAELVVLSERRAGRLLSEVAERMEEDQRREEERRIEEELAREREERRVEEEIREIEGLQQQQQKQEEGGGSSNNKDDENGEEDNKEGTNNEHQSKGESTEESSSTSGGDNKKKKVKATEEENSSSNDVTNQEWLAAEAVVAAEAKRVETNVVSIESQQQQQQQEQQELQQRRQQAEYNEDIALPHLALFELFCERNALAKIVNIVTGAAFLHDNDTTTSSTNSNNGVLLLPPLSIATQAIQSVSILIQNVSRATSLYFLLSNNRVNDLIKLPLHLYQRAESNAFNAARSKKSPKKRRQQLHQQSDMPELTTHFVSFLKSLAMRVNAETLQFFLSFPKMESSSSNNGNNYNGNNASGGSGGGGYLERREVVEFPLYARALEFCSPEAQFSSNSDSSMGGGAGGGGDSFVRVTAMNVCMNIIRLATIPNPEEDDDDDGDSDDEGSIEGGGGDGVEGDGENNKVPTNKTPLPTTTPSGLLHNAPPSLPLQDRIAIAQYACHPSRVGDLVGPLCARLTGQFGSVEGTVRALEELGEKDGVVDGGSNTAAAGGASKKKQTSHSNKHATQSKTHHHHLEQQQQRSKLTSSLQNLIANVQDELLLLDDLLKVGLISLNEQAIEMMLATFVYPMLLQPLLLPLRRFASSRNKEVEKEGSNEDGGGELHNNGVEAKDDGDGMKKEKGSKGQQKQGPVIVLQSPKPFSQSATTANTKNAGDKSGVETATSETDTITTTKSNGNGPLNPSTPTTATQTNTSLNTATNNITNTNSSNASMDLAPAKTALFGLSILFSTISNPTLRHLLLVAFLHPKSPEATGGMVICKPPKITLPKLPKKKKRRRDDNKRGSGVGGGGDGGGGGGVYSSDDFQLEIRMEKNQKQLSKETEGFQRLVNVYTFGTEPEEDLLLLDDDEGEEGGEDKNQGGGGFGSNDCVFILAPALVDILRNHTTTFAPPADKGEGDDDSIEGQWQSAHSSQEATTSTTTTTRSNPYRAILLKSISGTGEMVALQSLATAALHAAVVSSANVGIGNDYGDDAEDSDDENEGENKDGAGSTTAIVQTIMFPPSMVGRQAADMENDGADNDNNSPSNNDDVVQETLHSLSQSIINISITYDGWWRIKFNTVAARTLMDIIATNPTYLEQVDDIVKGMKLEAAEFLIGLPCRLDGKTRNKQEDRSSKDTPQANNAEAAMANGDVDNGTTGNNNTTSGNSNSGGGGSRQHLDHWLLDRFFFDQPDKLTQSVVENVCYLKEKAATPRHGGASGGGSGGDSDSSASSGNAGDSSDDNNADDIKEAAITIKKEQYRYGLEVLSTISTSETTMLLCDDTAKRVIDDMIVDGATRGNTPFHCAASWALACLYLDALCVKLSKIGNSRMEKVIFEEECNALSKQRQQQRKLSYISSASSDDNGGAYNYHSSYHTRGADDAAAISYSLAHISSKFAIAMLDEGEEASNNNSSSVNNNNPKSNPMPLHGSAVGLVGKAAFPCVCEVSSTFSSLFTGRTCISNEGIRWQSLYLVVTGRWAVLAEPGHGGTGGEGRVITACRLSCLAVKKDNSGLVNNKTPARRLLLAHASLDPRPPSLFLVDKSSTTSSLGGGGITARGGVSSGDGPNLGKDGLRLTRSRMDLWFEDANAAGHACKILSAKIAKARARRGSRIRAALLA